MAKVKRTKNVNSYKYSGQPEVTHIVGGSLNSYDHFGKLAGSTEVIYTHAYSMIH